MLIDEVNPCPYCKPKEGLPRIHEGKLFGKLVYWVMCTSCGEFGAKCSCNADAVKDWNERMRQVIKPHKLKACPFCAPSKKDCLPVYRFNVRSGRVNYYVYCPSCGATGGEALTKIEAGMGWSNLIKGREKPLKSENVLRISDLQDMMKALANVSDPTHIEVTAQGLVNQLFNFGIRLQNLEKQMAEQSQRINELESGSPPLYSRFEGRKIGGKTN